ncbi:NADH:flavin oxidoreductase/NADH oxidase, N-terminal [Kalmanozyma brasiliensis GHG001]|uniref:NADH:flavin oxidoreductase n=1 Tax=Kalmanozyma brasiliensis (strain GHG001) TaxID=1365824 RepID=V5ERN3_KALBG|nr:NADH:flavin oxidoreductase/NADH oxidase, N-terminal [Kalmanozyma brasiliensis GHG001]EST07815.1 NADH:flavin oxidoreductase/NADH oxidase, N-terminal [Kalmanozyma brasiliensis GHG001]
MSTKGKAPEAELIARTLEFKGGKVARNRLAKAPLEETLSRTGGGPPNHAHYELYRAWARGGWGLIITGNIAIDPLHLGTPWDITIPYDERNLTFFKTAMKRYADACTGRDQPDMVDPKSRPLAVVQLVHAGRQSMRGSGRGITKPALAPSAVPMSTMGGLGPVGRFMDHLLWGSVAAMTLEQVHELRDRFVQAALICAEAGFDGVELHGSHGYQLAAFLSPRTNLRTDDYGGSPENRARLLLEIVDLIRTQVAPDFLIGVKLNSSDYVQGGLTEDDALLNVKWLAETDQVDFVEISGGNYENPSFVMEGFDSEAEKAKLEKLSSKKNAADGKRDAKATGTGAATVQGSGADPNAKTTERTGKREAFFQNFARRCRSTLPEGSRLKIILTGGLRSRHGIASAINPDDGAADMACLGRPAAVFPALPLRLTDTSIDDASPEAGTPEFKVPAVTSLALVPIKIVGAGWGTLWHTFHMAQTVLGKSDNLDKSTYALIKDYTKTGATQTGFKEPNDDLFMLLVMVAIPMVACIGVFTFGSRS